MDLGIRNRRVLVTGASQGVGRSIALAFAREGARVTVLSRRGDELASVVAEMGGEKNGHLALAVDLMQSEAPTRALRSVGLEKDPFSIVVHNLGGTLGVKNPLSAVADWARVWQFNVGVAIEMNALLIPPMQEKRWGRVVHISSIAAETVRGAPPYAAAKAYLNAYIKGLGRGVAAQGVVVSGILAGAFISDGGHWDNIAKSNPAMMDDFLRHHHAIGRLGTADEIAPFALFLASEQATFAVAALIPVDGGTM